MERRTVKDKTDLVSYLSKELIISKKKAKAIIDTRRVFVNNRRIWMAGHMLKNGDIIEFEPEKKINTEFSVIFEDDFVIAVNKPSGIISDNNNASLESIIRKRYDIEIKAIHRLDRDTTGAILFAKKQQYFEAFKKIWKEKSVRKVYLAISHNEAVFKNTVIDREVDGKTALTRVFLIGKRNGFSYFRVEPVTGRKHQIRIHLSSIRHPIVGDKEFGLKKISDPLLKIVSRQMLHSYQIFYKCPFTGRDITLTAPIPHDFRNLLKTLELED